MEPVGEERLARDGRERGARRRARVDGALGAEPRGEPFAQRPGVGHPPTVGRSAATCDATSASESGTSAPVVRVLRRLDVRQERGVRRRAAERGERPHQRDRPLRVGAGQVGPPARGPRVDDIAAVGGVEVTGQPEHVEGGVAQARVAPVDDRPAARRRCRVLPPCRSPWTRVSGSPQAASAARRPSRSGQDGRRPPVRDPRAPRGSTRPGAGRAGPARRPPRGRRAAATARSWTRWCTAAIAATCARPASYPSTPGTSPSSIRPSSPAAISVRRPAPGRVRSSQPSTAARAEERRHLLEPGPPAAGAVEPPDRGEVPGALLGRGHRRPAQALARRPSAGCGRGRPARRTAPGAGAVAGRRRPPAGRAAADRRAGPGR